MPGARCTRGLVCKIVRKPHTSIQVQRRHSGIPCAMALRLMPCSPRRRIRLVIVAAGLMAISIRLDRIRHRQLGTSNGCRDHTVLPYALAPFVCALLIAHGNPPCDHAAHRRCRVHRIPSRVRDDARPPLLPGKDGRSGSADLPDGKSEIFFGMGLDRSLVIFPSGQFAAPARATSSLRAKRSEAIDRPRTRQLTLPATASRFAATPTVYDLDRAAARKRRLRTIRIRKLMIQSGVPR
jgi:hypothetical protein